MDPVLNPTNQFLLTNPRRAISFFNLCKRSFRVVFLCAIVFLSFSTMRSYGDSIESAYTTSMFTHEISMESCDPPVGAWVSCAIKLKVQVLAKVEWTTRTTGTALSCYAEQYDNNGMPIPGGRRARPGTVLVCKVSANNCAVLTQSIGTAYKWVVGKCGYKFDYEASSGNLVSTDIKTIPVGGCTEEEVNRLGAQYKDTHHFHYESKRVTDRCYELSRNDLHAYITKSFPGYTIRRDVRFRTAGNGRGVNDPNLWMTPDPDRFRLPWSPQNPDGYHFIGAPPGMNSDWPPIGGPRMITVPYNGPSISAPYVRGQR